MIEVLSPIKRKYRNHNFHCSFTCTTRLCDKLYVNPVFFIFRRMIYCSDIVYKRFSYHVRIYPFYEFCPQELPRGLLLGISNKIEHSERLKIDYKKICERLLELRKENHLTQNKLSDKIGFFQTTYSSFETGVRRPTTYKLLYIVNFYNASIDYVVGRTDTKKVYKRSSSKIAK